MDQAERKALHRDALEFAERAAESVAASELGPDSFALRNLRLVTGGDSVACTDPSLTELADLASDALWLIQHESPGRVQPLSWAIVERLAGVAFIEAKRTRIFAASYVNRAIATGVLSDKRADEYRADPERAVFRTGLAGAVARYLYLWDDSMQDNRVLSRVPTDLAGYEARHLLAAMALVWIDRAVDAAQGPRAIDGVQLVAASGVALNLAQLQAAGLRTMEEHSAARKRNARSAADSRHAPLRAIKAEIVGRYQAGNYRSANKAAYELAPLAIELSRRTSQPLSPFNAQKTVHGWLLAAGKAAI